MSVRGDISGIADTLANDYAKSWSIGAWFVFPFAIMGYMAQDWWGFNSRDAFLIALLVALMAVGAKLVSIFAVASARALPRTVPVVFSSATGEQKLTLVYDVAAKMDAVRGRTSANDPALIVLVDPKVSTAHCEVRFVDGKLQIVDLATANGTFVDGTRIRPGERVRVNRGSRVSLSNGTSVRLEQIGQD